MVEKSPPPCTSQKPNAKKYYFRIRLTLHKKSLVNTWFKAQT
jgi:hypothetical protein